MPDFRVIQKFPMGASLSRCGSIRVGLVPSNWLTFCSTSRELAPDENFELSPDWTATNPTRLCAHGGMQVEGIHFWDTYSPVTQMISVRLLLVLSLLLGLQSRGIDFTLAFTQAPIDVPNTYLGLPTGFSVEGDPDDFVLELKKTLYGLHQAGLNWFDNLRQQLLSLGFHNQLLTLVATSRMTFSCFAMWMIVYFSAQMIERL